MNGRRNFVKGFGLLSILFAGSAHAGAQSANTLLAGPSVPDTDSPDVGQSIDHLAPPSNAPTLSLQGAYGEPEPTPQYSSTCGIYTFAPINQVVTHRVELSVGKDNRLWIKVDDVWKRIALEG